jgi:hypothetical protein
MKNKLYIKIIIVNYNLNNKVIIDINDVICTSVLSLISQPRLVGD